LRVVTRQLPGYIRVMFGIGGEELVIIGLLVLVIFGPSKLSQMARDLGRFVNEARRSVDEFKGELVSGVGDEQDRKNKRKR
ncbi:MAG TPA: twin-arginine translocase TatA/TatE family subunit, partial [Rubrobacteraceae bacterium]|nr:twin-arginine translocase TatA/TatE family subunit [Rubrobacteraceae bacterium]